MRACPSRVSINELLREETVISKREEEDTTKGRIESE